MVGIVRAGERKSQFAITQRGEMNMSYKTIRVLVPGWILFAFALQFASAEAVQVRERPPGRQFSAWLKAINSGDRGAMQEFMDKSMPGRSVEPGLAIGKRSGGYDVRKVEESKDTSIVLLVQ